MSVSTPLEWFDWKDARKHLDFEIVPEFDDVRWQQDFLDFKETALSAFDKFGPVLYGPPPADAWAVAEQIKTLAALRPWLATFLAKADTFKAHGEQRGSVSMMAPRENEYSKKLRVNAEASGERELEKFLREQIESLDRKVSVYQTLIRAYGIELSQTNIM